MNIEIPSEGISIKDVLKIIQIKNPNKIFIIKDEKIFNYDFNFQINNSKFTRTSEFYTAKKNGHEYCIYGSENIKKILSTNQISEIEKINIAFLGKNYEFHRKEHNIKITTYEIKI